MRAKQHIVIYVLPILSKNSHTDSTIDRNSASLVVRRTKILAVFRTYIAQF